MGFYPAVATVGNVPTPLPVADGGTGVTWGSPLTVLSGILSSPVSVSSESTVLTTPTLAVGTWLILATLLGDQGTASTAMNWSARANGGTATYTVTGGNSATQARSASSNASNQVAELNLSFTVNVTVAGTVIITAFGDSGTPSIVNTTPSLTYANATGYVAVRIA